jgi:hypothetical protein
MSRQSAPSSLFALLKIAVLASVVSVGMTLLAVRLLLPTQTHAQAAQQGDIRATSFTLVGADGTVLAKLAAGPSGNGNLTLFDTAGRPRAAITGASSVTIMDANGKQRAGMFYVPTADLAEVGAFDADGKQRMGAGYAGTLNDPFVSVYGDNGPGSAPCPARATLHLRADGSYGFDACDADGNLIYTAP